MRWSIPKYLYSQTANGDRLAVELGLTNFEVTDFGE